MLVDNNQPVISAVSIIELDSDNQTKYGENSIRILGPGMTLKLQFNADESILEPSITLKVDGVNDNVTILDLSDNGTQWSVNYPVGDTTKDN